VKPGEIRWGKSALTNDKLLLQHDRHSELIGMIVQRGDKWGVRTRRKEPMSIYSAAFGEDITLNFDTKEEARRYLWVTAHMRD
jgi:hypothetical protein